MTINCRDDVLLSYPGFCCRTVFLYLVNDYDREVFSFGRNVQPAHVFFVGLRKLRVVLKNHSPARIVENYFEATENFASNETIILSTGIIAASGARKSSNRILQLEASQAGGAGSIPVARSNLPRILDLNFQELEKRYKRPADFAVRKCKPPMDTRTRSTKPCSKPSFSRSVIA